MGTKIDLAAMVAEFGLEGALTKIKAEAEQAERQVEFDKHSAERVSKLRTWADAIKPCVGLSAANESGSYVVTLLLDAKERKALAPESLTLQAVQDAHEILSEYARIAAEFSAFVEMAIDVPVGFVAKVTQSASGEYSAEIKLPRAKTERKARSSNGTGPTTKVKKGDIFADGKTVVAMGHTIESGKGLNGICDALGLSHWTTATKTGPRAGDAIGTAIADGKVQMVTTDTEVQFSKN